MVKKKRINPDCPLSEKDRVWCNLYEKDRCRPHIKCPYRPLRMNVCKNCGAKFISEKGGKHKQGDRDYRLCPDCVNKMIVTRRDKHGTAAPKPSQGERIKEGSRWKRRNKEHLT